MAVVRRTALLFFPVAILIFSTLYAFYDSDRASLIESLIDKERVIVHQQKKHFTRVFNNIVSDLLVLTGHADFTEMLNDPDEDIERHIHNISQEFLSFVDHKGVYDQLRYINMQGQEIVRIDLNDKNPRIIPEEKLQNKSGRYYFKRTVALEKNQVYISPFDLNVENGSIERPLKPMLRVAIPIIDKFNVRHGIVILNYLGRALLHELKDIAASSAGHPLVLNADGYWLQGLHQSDEWGFMFPDKKERTFQSRFPDEWDHISSQSSGHLITEHGLFTYTTINPLFRGWRSSSGNYRAYLPEAGDINISNYSWKVVSFVAAEKLLADSERLNTPMLILSIILTFVWGMYALIASVAKVQKKHAQRALQEKDRRIHEIVDSAFDGIITINEKGIIDSFNPAASTIFGYTPEEIIGKKINTLTPSPHREMHDSYINHYIETGEAHIIDSPREVEAVRKDGSTFPMSLCVGARDYGDHWMFTGIVRDITERKEMEAELQRMAVTDALTGLYNRGFLNTNLENEYRRATRYHLPLSLIILDIDHFKNVNDSYGHPAGDKVLIHIARELNKQARDSDVVARYGGEEFVLILPQTDGDHGLILAERLRSSIEELEIPVDELELKVTISIGLVSTPATKTESADHFLTIADRALYQAKESGRNRVVLSTE